jgi:hypothetical protein
MIEQAVCTHKHFSSRSSSFERSRVLYRSALGRGRRGQFWSKLTGGSRCLLSLKSTEANCRVRIGSDVGQRTVPIAQIRGSEGRTGDFDCDFNPIKDHTRQRWLGIAAAREQGKMLPPVSLVQIGDIYFVKDGHHRISVARAFGQETIEAKVVVWQVERALPWEISVCASGCEPVGQSKGEDILLASCGARARDYKIVSCWEFVVSRLRWGWHWGPSSAVGSNGEIV